MRGDPPAELDYLLAYYRGVYFATVALKGRLAKLGPECREGVREVGLRACSVCRAPTCPTSRHDRGARVVVVRFRADCRPRQKNPTRDECGVALFPEARQPTEEAATCSM